MSQKHFLFKMGLQAHKILLLLACMGILTIFLLSLRLTTLIESTNTSKLFTILKPKRNISRLSSERIENKENTISNIYRDNHIFSPSPLHYLKDQIEPCLSPWKADKECLKFNICFARENQFQPKALVSFPGSGNTWIRYLIEASTGFFTGSVLNDEKLYTSGFLGEKRSPDDGTTIVQKTHNFNLDAPPERSEAHVVFGYRGILLIRNPFDALISNRDYISSRNHTGFAKAESFDSEKWVNFVKLAITGWSRLITKWIDNSNDYLIVLYENVCENPRQEVSRMLDYLGEDVNIERVRCLLKPENLHGKFQRSNVKHPGQEVASPVLTEESQVIKRKLRKAKVVKMIEDKINFVNDVMKRKGLNYSLPYSLENSSKKYLYL